MSYQPSWGQDPQQPQPPPGGGMPQYQGGYPQPGAPPKNDGTAVAALVCSIVCYVFGGFIVAIVALILARSSERKIAESNGQLGGEGLNKVARILAWINIALSLVVLVVVIIIIIVAVVSDSSSSALALIG